MCWGVQGRLAYAPVWSIAYVCVNAEAFARVEVLGHHQLMSRVG